VTLLHVYELLGFLLGLLFGSFLNVCISRLPTHESIVKPGSHCMACGHTILWYDNLPVVSWMLLRGRCRDCKAGISWRYPAVELAVGVWFAYVASWLNVLELATGSRASGPSPTEWMDVLGFAIFGFLLIGLMVMDWQTERLPDAFTLTGIGIGFALACVQAFFLSPGAGDIVLNTTHQLRMSSPGSFQSQGNVFLTGSEALVLGRIAAIAGAALLLLAVSWGYRALRGREGMGLGDVKLLAMIAAFLGFGEAMFALFAASLVASFYAIFLVLRRHASGSSRLPLGSFLAAGGLFSALFGPGIIDWYMGLLR
jgi:leader peptidase (prepilin peptidase)/N-methyltransferase